MDTRYNAPRPQPRQPKPGELLFEFVVGDARWRCELRDDGEQGGVDAQFFKDDAFVWSQRWWTRDLAVAWAEQKRTALVRQAGSGATTDFPSAPASTS